MPTCSGCPTAATSCWKEPSCYGCETVTYSINSIDVESGDVTALTDGQEPHAAVYVSPDRTRMLVAGKTLRLYTEDGQLLRALPAPGVRLRRRCLVARRVELHVRRGSGRLLPDLVPIDSGGPPYRNRSRSGGRMSSRAVPAPGSKAKPRTMATGIRDSFPITGSAAAARSSATAIALTRSS